MRRDTQSRGLAAQERAAVTRKRDLARQIKEAAKLSALEQAKLEVEAFEADLDVLLSVHREASQQTDWLDLLCQLPPHLAAEQSSQDFESTRERVMHMRDLARRVLAGEGAAYIAAVHGHSPFREMTSLGATVQFQLEERHVLECKLLVRGRDAIPPEQKSLTATGKLSVKPMQKARFHEIYQDYVCSCVLRVAREVFALLPIDLVIVTAAVAGKGDAVNASIEIPVLSAAMPRAAFEGLDFATLDPSDAIMAFAHRGDVAASRKTGEFVAVVPLRPKDVAPLARARASVEDLVTQVRDLRGRLASLTGAVHLTAKPNHT